jgi:hypothetical protein
MFGTEWERLDVVKVVMDRMQDCRVTPRGSGGLIT